MSTEKLNITPAGLEARPEALDAIFAALADPTRRAILAELRRGESSVTKLAEPFGVTLQAVSRHISVLESAGLIAREREGRTHRLRLAAGPLREAVEWLAAYGEFWERRFDALDRLLGGEAGEEGE